MLRDRLTNVQILKATRVVVGNVNPIANEFIKKKCYFYNNFIIFSKQILKDKLLSIFFVKKSYYWF